VKPAYVLVASLFITVLAVFGYFAFAKNSYCSIRPGLSLFNASKGLYYLPTVEKSTSDAGPYYIKKCNFLLAPPGDCKVAGKPETLNLLINVAKRWVTDKGTYNKFVVGDIYSTGHASHTTGYEIDIYAYDGVASGLFRKKPILPLAPGYNVTTNLNYNQVLTTQLAIEFLKSNGVRYIISSDKEVVDHANSYAAKYGLYGRMQWDGASIANGGCCSALNDHWDHFHVHVEPGRFSCI